MQIRRERNVCFFGLVQRTLITSFNGKLSEQRLFFAENMFMLTLYNKFIAGYGINIILFFRLNHIICLPLNRLNSQVNRIAIVSFHQKNNNRKTKKLMFETKKITTLLLLFLAFLNKKDSCD